MLAEIELCDFSEEDCGSLCLEIIEVRNIGHIQRSDSLGQEAQRTFISGTI